MAMGLSQAKLAQELGCTQGLVWQYERGCHVIPPERAAAFIKVARDRNQPLSFDALYGHLLEQDSLVKSPVIPA